MRLSASRSTFTQQAAAADVGLSQPAYALLRILIDEGPQPISGLARTAHMDLAMATRQLNSLAETGWVTRSPDPDDGRVSLVEVTAAGSAAAGALQDVRRHHLERALARWSASELGDLDRILARFLADTTATSFDEN
ncbi:MarR family transcriptional regulator [Mycobacterium sp. Y57]|nr:MarR family transcriptional regulator [Mycolicibacterium xanthum]